MSNVQERTWWSSIGLYPGPAATGIVVYNSDNQKILESSSYLGRATNNQAEYQALILGLGQIQKMVSDKVLLTETNVTAYLDSELVVKQLKGEYRVKNKGLQPLVEKALKLTLDFNQVNFFHIPRHNNKEADRLVNQELNKRV